MGTSKTKWKRPSGNIIDIQDTPELIGYAKANGWTKARAKPKARKVIKDDNSIEDGGRGSGEDRSKDSRD